jgi:ABC-type enterochelin transport system permease subunit
MSTHGVRETIVPMIGKLLRSVVVTVGTFVIAYVTLVVSYIAWFAWAARTKAMEPVPIFRAAIPLALICAICAGVFTFIWMGQTAE